MKILIQLESFEGLDANDIRSNDFHGLDDLGFLELPDDLGALLLWLLGSLDRHELVALLSDDGLDFAT